MCLAVPGRVESVFDEGGMSMAVVDFGGVTKKVCLAYLPETGVGEYVIVHVGFAIQRLDEASALESLALFEQLGVIEEELGQGVTPAEQGRSADPATTS